MKEIEIEELKRLQVDMLKCIDNFCVSNGIKYSLSSGTLIGAVRHQGYIPWDDDIDIMMLRDDYDRFVQMFNGSYSHLSLLAPELDWGYYAPYANVFDNRTLLREANNGHRGVQLGVKIDIFPIDFVAVDEFTYKKNLQKVARLQDLMWIKRLHPIWRWSDCDWRSLLSVGIIRIKQMLLSVIPYSFLQKRIKAISVNRRYFQSEYVDNVVYNAYWKKLPRFKSKCMDVYIRVPFENIHCSIIKDYDEVLRAMYGDYMQLPPIHQRVAHHNFTAFWKD